MTSTSITAPGLSGVLRLTWVHDDLAHVLEHADVDEPSGTWIGLARRDHELALEGDVDNVTLRHLAAEGKIADLVWEAPKSLPLNTSKLSRPQCRPTTQRIPSLNRAALAAVAGNLVTGLGGELRGA
jgi:hypothetical protein